MHLRLFAGWAGTNDVVTNGQAKGPCYTLCMIITLEMRIIKSKLLWCYILGVIGTLFIIWTSNMYNPPNYSILLFATFKRWQWSIVHYHVLNANQNVQLGVITSPVRTIVCRLQEVTPSLRGPQSRNCSAWGKSSTSLELRHAWK